MSILEKAEIGSSVQVNLELSRDRLTKETIDAINVSSLGKICDFRITDGKGIGVVLKLSNGKEQWFFEDEIDLLDENGNVIKNNNNKKSSNFIFNFLRGLNYQIKNNYMQNLLQRDLGSSMLSIAVILGWLGLFFVFLRVLTISIKRILEAIFKKS